jgi:hypothetical protein
MEGDRIAEVRGIAKDQHLDPYISPVVQEKLKEFPDGPKYEKKASDMKILTRIEAKMNKEEPLGKDELRFLYEIGSKIEGFGYSRDPRIQELRSKRNSKEDAPVVFGCAPDEIAWSRDQVNEHTKAYVGPLFPGVFEKLGHLEHLYTSFPEGQIKHLTVEIGGKTPKEYERNLKREGFKIDGHAKDLLAKMPTSKESGRPTLSASRSQTSVSPETRATMRFKRKLRTSASISLRPRSVQRFAFPWKPMGII